MKTYETDIVQVLVFGSSNCR